MSDPKVVLISGASSGIGRAIADRLAAPGPSMSSAGASGRPAERTFVFPKTCFAGA
jgi:NAD(P)-dependent dehydrogenase (short-subunit alcohol dehydrogenase family)